MPLLTVITPTYNRSDFICRIYENLQKQTCQAFEWIVVDDGSTDDTSSVVEAMRNGEQASFGIQLVRKENGGKHTAVNAGVCVATGLLTLILDSDDELPVNAVETIVRRWQETEHKCEESSKQAFGGLAFCMAHRDGGVITAGKWKNRSLPIEANEIDLRYRYKVSGDICEVFRTDVLREYPFPEISNERFCPEQLVWFRIANRYSLRFYDDVVYFRDYLEGGLTDNIVRIRMKSPVASCMTYSEMLEYPIPFLQKVKAAINFWRFHCCVNSVTSQVPRVKCCWQIFRPIGYLMHLNDRRIIG
ncbi:MAG: glycosyltransferase family 2 protein [Prevotella sp.]|jgi:glycosyltransferase involved in cell wall biosynthesis